MEQLRHTLGIFQKGREYAVQQILEDIYLQQSFFKYRKNKNAMALVIDRYQISILLYHFEIANEENPAIKVNLSKLILKLVERLTKIKSSEFTQTILCSKRDILKDMLLSADNMQNKYNRLLVCIEQDKAKYEDEIARIGTE